MCMLIKLLRIQIDTLHGIVAGFEEIEIYIDLVGQIIDNEEEDNKENIKDEENEDKEGEKDKDKEEEKDVQENDGYIEDND